MTIQATRSFRTLPRLIGSITLVGSVLGISACGEAPRQPESESEITTTPTKIHWHEGDVDSAFALAKSSGKPLFLYWGAEWCPPCHYLKNKIFTRPSFVDRMQDFVPVYLDGDTARAQILGEELDVQGYPTVIVFNPLGEEVMRMPSTVAVDEYETILDSAIASMKPVDQVLDEVLARGPAKAQAADLNLLAFYSWGQDSLVDLGVDEQVEAFRRLYQETPNRFSLERSRFLGLYVVALARQASQDGEGEAPSLSEEDSASLRTAILEVLADPEERNANLLWIDYYATLIIDFLQPEDSPGRYELLGAWQQAAKAMETDESLSVDDRLSATVLRIDLVQLTAHSEAEEVPVPASLQEHVRERVDWALETVTDESELQTVVNTLAYMLEKASLEGEAEEMLLAKMNDTAAPYYFMSWIAGLKADAGETGAAIDWYRRAYDASQGRYSRFRWGSTYLRRLMDLSPEEADRIEADSLEVLSELLTHDDAFAGGNYARLDGLQGSYWEWNEDGSREAELERIRDHVHAACDRFPTEGSFSQRDRCESFLVAEVIEGEAAM